MSEDNNDGVIRITLRWDLFMQVKVFVIDADNCITLRTKKDNNFPVLYKNYKILQRFSGLIYSF